MKSNRVPVWTFLTLPVALGVMLAAPSFSPAADAPKPDAPKADAPKTDTPKTEAPKKEVSAVEFIDALSKQVIGLLGNKKLALPERRKRIQDVAYANIDFTTLSRLAVGPLWQRMSGTQRKDFMTEFRVHLANTYRSMIDNYNDEQVKVVSDRDEGRGDHTVLTKVIDPKNGDETKVDYRVRKTPEGWRVIDITIEGISLAANFRSQIQEIGDPDRLIKMVHEKNVAAESDSGPTTQPGK